MKTIKHFKNIYKIYKRKGFLAMLSYDCKKTLKNTKNNLYSIISNSYLPIQNDLYHRGSDDVFYRIETRKYKEYDDYFK